MPSVLIEVRQEYSPEEETQLMTAVHSALIECFKISPDDRNVRLLVHLPHRFQCPPEKASPELYTHISIDCFFGRFKETKKSLYKAIVRNLGEFGIPDDHIKILLREIPRENWGIKGGNMASEVILGFEVEV